MTSNHSAWSQGVLPCAVAIEITESERLVQWVPPPGHTTVNSCVGRQRGLHDATKDGVFAEAQIPWLTFPAVQLFRTMGTFADVYQVSKELEFMGSKVCLSNFFLTVPDDTAHNLHSPRKSACGCSTLLPRRRPTHSPILPATSPRYVAAVASFELRWIRALDFDWGYARGLHELNVNDTLSGRWTRFPCVGGCWVFFCRRKER